MEFKILILFALIGVLGATAAGIIMLAIKWRIIQWYEINRAIWMPEKCIFCLAFWLSSILLALMFFGEFPFDWLFLMSPLPAAAIARYIHEGNTPKENHP